MINIEPQSSLMILNTPLLSDNKNQLTFSNQNAQTNYFLSKVIYNLGNSFTYIKKDKYINVDIPIDQLYNCNYIMFKNNGFIDKYFYGFIINMEYLNENTTKIFYENDVFQNWQFDIQLKQSFIEREHVSDDTIGANLVKENIDSGENEIIGTVVPEGLDLTTQYFIIVASNFNPAHSKEYASVTITNKIPNSTHLYLFRIYVDNNTWHGLTDFYLFLQDTNRQGKISDILNIYILPYYFIMGTNPFLSQYILARLSIDSGSFDVDGTTFTYNFYEFLNSGNAENSLITFDARKSWSDYTPKNNKCYCYPYNYIYATNNAGNNNIYRYEFFNNENNQAQFQLSTCVANGGSGVVIPLNYKKSSQNMPQSYLEQLPLAKYPTLSWTSDAYTNWLTQNAINIPMQMLSIGADTGLTLASIATDNLLSATMSTINLAEKIGNMVGQFYEAKLLPNINGGVNTGDIAFANGSNNIYFYQMRSQLQFIKIVDNYFSMFGYKINNIKVPNINSRANWNYIKTTDANILGNVPQFELQKIKNLFNTGITFWHNPNTFLDYSQSNNIV